MDIHAKVSVLIAVCAFIITVWQTWVTRKHNRLSVKPWLSTWVETNSIPYSYEIRLNNIGIGPAIINSFDIYVDGHKVEGSGLEPITKTVHILFPTKSPTILYSSYLGKGGILGANASLRILLIQFTPENLPAPELMEHIQKRVKLVIRYTSIYKDEIVTYDSSLNHT